MSLSSSVVAVALNLCFPSETSFASNCAAALSDDQLAGASAGFNAIEPLALVRALEAQASDQMRQTGSIAGAAQYIFLSEAEAKALAQAIHPFDEKAIPSINPDAPLSSLSSLLTPTLYATAEGNATISVDIRMSNLRIGDVDLGPVEIHSSIGM